MKKSLSILLVVLSIVACTDQEKLLKLNIENGVKRFAYSIGQDTTKVFVDSIRIFRTVDELFPLEKMDTTNMRQKRQRERFTSTMKDSLICFADLFIEASPNLYEVYELHFLVPKDYETLFPDEKKKPSLNRLYRTKEYCGRNSSVPDSVFRKIYAAEQVLKNRMKYPDSFEVLSSRMLTQKPESLKWGYWRMGNEEDMDFFEIEASAINGFGGKSRTNYIMFAKKTCSFYHSDVFWTIETES